MRNPGSSPNHWIMLTGPSYAAFSSRISLLPGSILGLPFDPPRRFGVSRFWRIPGSTKRSRVAVRTAKPVQTTTAGWN
jgi:hypothetical protein